MIKQRRRWPYPGDTPLDRARHIARTLLAELDRHAPEQAAAISERMAELGEQWLTPQPVLHDPQDWITLEAAATYTGGTRDMIYKWVTRGQLNPRRDNNNRILVQLGQVIEVQRQLRMRRAHRAS